MISDGPSGLSIPLGRSKISASHCLSPRSGEIVLLTGVVASDRSISMIESEMPRKLESVEQGAAWVAWCLDQRKYKTEEHVPWIELGRMNRHLLPWERQRAAYEARPHCLVSRDWARLALRKLRVALRSIGETDPVDFSFDGEVLRIRCGERLIAMPASGKAWEGDYRLFAGMLAPLPKRLMFEYISVAVWESALSLGNPCYTGVVMLNPDDSERSQMR